MQRRSRWGRMKRRRWQCLCTNAFHSSDGRKQLYGPLLYGVFLEYRAKRSIRFANQGECVPLCVCLCLCVGVSRMPLTGAHNY